MKTIQHPRATRPVIMQAQNNTYNWIGHQDTDPDEHFAGQTFTCPQEGELDNIQVLSAAVQHPGTLQMTLFHFNPHTRSWGQVLESVTVTLQQESGSRWIAFPFDGQELKKGETYGFKLSSHDTLVAIGEAATGSRAPFAYGEEWMASSSDKEGHFFQYFSLTFRVELKAA